MSLQKPDLTKPAFQIMPEVRERITNFKCPMCRANIIEGEFRDTLSKKEYSISGMCQKCQDKTFRSGKCK